MEIMLIILQLLTLAAVAILALFYIKLLPAYLVEKGKNVATREDIEEITRKIEGVKAEFFEHQARYSLSHQKRFEVTGRTFELLHDPYEYIKYMVHPAQHDDEEEEAQRQEQAIDAFNQFSGYYWKHKIYLPEDLCKRVEAVLEIMKDVVNKYTIGRKGYSSKHGLELWAEAYEAMKSKVPALRLDLEKQFRENVTVREYADAGAQLPDRNAR